MLNLDAYDWGNTPENKLRDWVVYGTKSEDVVPVLECKGVYLVYLAPTETYYALNFGGGYTFRNNYSVPSTKGSFKRAKAAFEKYAGDKLYKG